jgi:membrane associated rhomboid family serine protease
MNTLQWDFPRWRDQALIVRVLLILACASTIALALGAWRFISFLMLSEGALAQGGVWRLFTYALPHGGLWHLFFNALVLWMFTPALAEALGNKRLTLLLLFAIAVGGAAHVLASPQPVIGLSAGVYAVLLYSAWLWPKRKILVFFVFPMPLAFFVVILAGIEFLLSLQGGGTTSHWAHLGGLAAGLLLALLWGREVRGMRRGFSSPKKSAPPGAPGGAARGIRRIFRDRVGFYLWKRRLAKRNAEQARVDELLQKISEQGMGSLSESERRFLDRVSKKRSQMKN